MAQKPGSKTPRKAAPKASSSVADAQETLPAVDESKPSQIVFAQGEAFSGPIPPPEMMKGYGSVQKDFPERILKMAEENGKLRIRMTEQTQDHNIKTETKQQDIDDKHITEGRRYGFLLCVIIMIPAMILAWNGHEKVSIALILGVFGSGLALFIRGRRSQDKK